MQPVEDIVSYVAWLHDRLVVSVPMYVCFNFEMHWISFPVSSVRSFHCATESGPKQIMFLK